jgi:hypothetical protein
LIDQNNWSRWNISATGVGVMTYDATCRYVELNPGLLWEKQDSTRRM